MSTTKNASKTSSTKKKISESSKAPSTRTRDVSTSERSNIKNKDVLQKPKAPTRTSIKNVKGSVEDKQSTSQLKIKPERNTAAKTSSRSTSVDRKKIVSSSSKSKKNSNENPDTPPSSRVMKTQYFPSKNLYTNALKNSDMKLRSVGDNGTRNESVNKPTLSEKVTVNKRSTTIGSKKKAFDKSIVKPNKIKETASGISSPESSWSSERPRTATLRKGSIVNENIVGPEAPKSLTIAKPDSINEITSTLPSPNQYSEYEDDFDSYESDFEKYSSSSETSNGLPVSGEETSSISSEDLETNTNRNNQLQTEPSGSQTTTERVYSAEIEKKLDSGTFELRDFKRRQLLQNIKESIEKENATIDVQFDQRNNPSSLSDEGFEEQKSLQFINFLDAQRKCERKRVNEMRKKRGDEILSMIRLDTVSFTIFELPSMPYEVFIRNYGSSNGIQISTQTGEDDVSEATQTDIIEAGCKWTQFPTKFSNLEPNGDHFWDLYRSEYQGVGIETPKVTEDFEDVNETKLEGFLKSSVNLILDIMAEENIGNLERLSKWSPELPFSDGYIQFNTSNEFLNHSKVRYVSIFPRNLNKLLTVHTKTSVKFEDIHSVLCLWDISNYEIPQFILVSFGEVCCCTFAFETSKFIFGGENDGSILVWNLKDKSNMYDISNRTPSYRTGIGQAHNSKVVSVRDFKKDMPANNNYFKEIDTTEICSLDEDGVFIVWSLFVKTRHDNGTDDVKLIKTSTVELQHKYPELPNLRCSDFILMNKNIYVSTNYGTLLHYVIGGGRSKVKKFDTSQQCEATCLDSCPFSTNLFVAGFLNGNLTLHSDSTQGPLIVLSNPDNVDDSSIQLIQWSETKPFVLYAKDRKNNIHVWDLSKSDIYPEYSVPFDEHISCLKLSPVLNVEGQEMSYMVIGTEDGNVYLHLLNAKYGQETPRNYRENVETFLNYVNRL